MHFGRVLVQVLALGGGQPRVVLGAAVPELEPETEPEQARDAEQVEQRVPGASRPAQDQPTDAHRHDVTEVRSCRHQGHVKIRDIQPGG